MPQQTFTDIQPIAQAQTFSNIVPIAPPAAGPKIDMQTTPMNSVESTVADEIGRSKIAAQHTVQHVAAMGKQLANDVYDVSTPNIATQIYRKLKGLPNDVDKLPGKAVQAFFAAAGIPEEELAGAGVEAGAAKEALAAKPVTEAATAVTGPARELTGSNIPRTLSGESALRQVLGGQDNANLMKIAKSRGINVTQEAQLRPGVADSRLISKIVDSFSDDELDNLRSTYVESTRMGAHQFGDVGPEAWKTMSLQTYFPEVKISAATLKRTQAAIGKAAPKEITLPEGQTEEDLTPMLQESLRRARAMRQAATAQ